MESHASLALAHDPSNDNTPDVLSRDSDLVEHLWLELLRDGLTFDISGLAPGPASSIPDAEHRFDFEQSPGAMRLEAVRLVPGKHLAGGERSMPVARCMIEIARDLIHHFDHLTAVVWGPAKSVIGRRYFESITTAWLEGGPFPALGLTAFRETSDGALESEGLKFWIGQELRLEPPLSADRVDATRLGVRLINQLVLIGGLEQADRLTAPDGSQLVMRPSANRRFVRVWRE